LLFCVDLGASDPLRWVVTPSKLPLSVWFSSAVHSSFDSEAIYAFGGDGAANQVVKYNLATGQVESAGQFPPLLAGAAALGSGPNIFYMGGVNGQFNRNITRYSTLNGETTVVNELPTGGMSQFASASNRLWLATFGGFDGRYLDAILRFDLVSNEIMQVGAFPDALYGATAVFAPDNGQVYIFGGNNGSINTQNAYDIWQFNPNTYVTTKLPTRLPRSVFNGCAVYANGIAYIFHHSGLIEFNPQNGQATVADIDDTTWPPYLHGAACVWVEQQQRIYVLGGHGNFGGNDIAYVEIE